MEEVTFGDFAKLATRRGWTVDALAQKFRGRIDDPREYFTRVLGGRYSDVVIPYRSVLELYSIEFFYRQDEMDNMEVCACGCGLQVRDRRKWASPGCRQRAYRQRVTDHAELRI